MKKYIVLLLVSLELYLIGYLMFVVVPADISDGVTAIGMGFGFMLVFFTSIGIVLYAIEDRTPEQVEAELKKLEELQRIEAILREAGLR